MAFPSSLADCAGATLRVLDESCTSVRGLACQVWRHLRLGRLGERVARARSIGDQRR